MELPPRDFESRASTSFTTPAIYSFISYASIKPQKQEDNFFAIFCSWVPKISKKWVYFDPYGHNLGTVKRGCNYTCTWTIRNNFYGAKKEK